MNIKGLATNFTNGIVAIGQTGFAIRRHLAYLKYVVRHKYYVFLACIKLSVPIWIALFHDWDKFLPSEWFPYARTFYNEDGSRKEYVPSNMAYGWNAHQKRNKHHWQYWLLTWDHGGTDCLDMPDVYVSEMIADWMGAGQAVGKPDTAAWYKANRDKMKLSNATRKRVEVLLIVYANYRL